MNRIAFVVVLLLAAGVGSTEPRAEEGPARPAPKSASLEAETSAAADAPATADAPGAADAPDATEPQTKWALPDLPPPDETQLQVGTARRSGPLATFPAPTKGLPKPGVSSPGPKAPKPGAGAESGSRTLLASMTAQSVVEGEAHVTVAEGERVLRPGDLLGAFTVRSVAEGLIVFDRPAVAGQPGGPATVIVRFEANGRARVRVLYEQDPTPVQAPRMK